MPSAAQILLFVSYSIVAIAVALLPPRMLDADPNTCTIVAMFVFFTCWQIHRYLIAREEKQITEERLERLEDFARKLRSDIKKTKDAFSNSSEAYDIRIRQMVSELKVLQTLLGQVMDRENELGSTKKNAPKTKTKKQTEPEVIDLPQSSDNTTVEEGPKDSKGTENNLAPAIESEEELLAIVHSALSENRVDLYLQPIVHLPDRKAKFYECFSRIRDESGAILRPSAYLKVAEEAGLVGTIDNLLLFRLIQLVRRLGPRQPDMRFICNLARSSVNDEEFFPQFIDFMATNGEFSERLVFEISQDDYKALDDESLERIFTLSRHGYTFSMDNVTDVDFDFLKLSRQNFRFVKADVDTLVGMGDDLGVLKAFLGRNNLHLIASHMEEERDVLNAVDQQVSYAQGYVFGKPQLSQDVL